MKAFGESPSPMKLSKMPQWDNAMTHPGVFHDETLCEDGPLMDDEDTLVLGEPIPTLPTSATVARVDFSSPLKAAQNRSQGKQTK